MLSHSRLPQAERPSHTRALSGAPSGEMHTAHAAHFSQAIPFTWDARRSARPRETFQRLGQALPNLAALQCQAWRKVFVELSTLIGTQAVISLYQRSLWQCRPEQPPRLVMRQHQEPLEQALAQLQALLSSQSPIAAAATQAVLARHFAELLSRLVGADVAERTLRPLLWPLWHDGAGRATPS